MLKKRHTAEIAGKWDQSASCYDQEYIHGIRSELEKTIWSNILNKYIGSGKYKVLDVGTGTGNLAILAAELGHEVKGLDISRSMLNKALDKAEQQSLKINFELGDAQNLSGEDDSCYDYVISRYMFWTIEDPLTALNEWMRVLKPGGKIIIIDGEWYDRKLSYVVKMTLGKALDYITGRKQDPNQKFYDEGLKKALPLMGNDILKKTVSYLEQAGMTDISIDMLAELKASERRVASCKERLLNPQNKYLISAIKINN